MGPEPGVNQRNFPRLPLLSASIKQAALLTQAVIFCTSILSALHFTSPLQGGGPAPRNLGEEHGPREGVSPRRKNDNFVVDGFHTQTAVWCPVCGASWASSRAARFKDWVLKNILYEQSSRRREAVVVYLMYTKCMPDIAISPLHVLSPQSPPLLFPFSLKQQIFLESVKQSIEQLVLAVFSLCLELHPSAWRWSNLLVFRTSRQRSFPMDQYYLYVSLFETCFT